MTSESQAWPTSGTPAPSFTPVDALTQLSFVVHGLLERRAGERDVSIVLTRLMGILRDRTPTMNQLAGLLDLDKSSVSGLVDRAVRRGLVERVPSPTDRRRVHVTLTPAGRRLAAEVTGRFGSDIDELLRGLSATDRKTLTRIATSILTRHASRRGLDLSESSL